MHHMIPIIFRDQFGFGISGMVLEAQFTSSHDKLLREADDMAESRAWKQIEAERAKWSAMLPKRSAELLPWLLQQSDDVTSNLFAFCVAATLDSVSGSDRAHPVNTLCNVLNLDMTKYWMATQASYLNHISKGRIAEVVSAALSADAASPLVSSKKDQAASMAERLLSETGWLPEVLVNREVPRDYSLASSETEEEDSDDEEGSREEIGGEEGQ
ncbi:nuclease [Caballeronia fortuita]|uniref:Nuclease n=1 Tax=Caballeronia fortuita TaxID=1777138 RepID=A0A158CM00_9BURK|nr:hypothetical protein [Caballeronia fortuita]SAK83332.1 nuclease [Caballeronia fortuita]